MKSSETATLVYALEGFFAEIDKPEARIAADVVLIM
jgi:hypothetical protein